MKWGHQGVAIKPMLYLSWYIGLIFHLNYVLFKKIEQIYMESTITQLKLLHKYIFCVL